jgi:hypothetical protein
MQNKFTNKIIKECGVDKQTIILISITIDFIIEYDAPTAEEVEAEIIDIVNRFLGSNKNKSKVVKLLLQYYIEAKIVFEAKLSDPLDPMITLTRNELV